MNPYEEYIQNIADLVQKARAFPLGGVPDYPAVSRPSDAPVALIFSPHPDDEVIIGGWALRLLRESRWRVINVAVTQGSSLQRQQERWKELTDCCRCVGFDLQATAPNGLEGANVKTRANDAAGWSAMVKVIADILTQHQPRAIFSPHEGDWNSTHVGTHYLVTDALASMPPTFRCAAVEPEFWAQMPSPNVLVESSPADVAALVTALTWHVGEVRRNPYHLTLPAWMMDNVRRGGEWVGGQGHAAPAFLFGTLYRLRNWIGDRFEDGAVTPGFMDAAQDPSAPLLEKTPD
jgi:LmbE family N-acetylglucosaminyl deacetylase